MKSSPLVVLCGFLGSGKTTLLRRWRKEDSLKDAAILVHDLSEFGLDAELVSDEDQLPPPGKLVNRVAALHGEHAREHLQNSVGKVLGDIAELQPPAPVLICESTGAARPWPLIRAMTQDKRFELRHFIVCVDALNLHRDFSDGKVLTGEAPSPQDEALTRAAGVLAEQIAFANIIILTKIDTIADPIIETQIKTLQAIQPRAAIGLSAQAGLLLSQLESTPAPKLAELEELASRFQLPRDAVTLDNVEAEILRDPRPFHPQRLMEACQRYLGTGLYRSKGYVWLASRPGDVLLWQQSGSQIALEYSGIWRAEVALNRDGTLLPEEAESLNQQLKVKHPLFGDRHNELTLIGLEADRNSFYQALEAALCTEEEIEAWLNGESFEDPWPKTIRRFD